MQTMIKTALSVLAILLPALVSAHDFEVNGIYYNINGNEATVTYQGSYAGQYNEYSGDIVIPETVTYDGITYDVTAIGEHAFENCADMTSIDIPNSVTTVGYHAFANCYGLASVTLPTSVTSLAYYAFEGCYHISSITLSGEGEWRGGTISILRPVQVSIGSQITSVKGMYVRPSAVYCYATTPPVCDANSFTDYSCTLHVPAASLAAYQAAPYWQNFTNIIGDAVEALLGDIDGDNLVNISDLSLLIDYLLDHETTIKETNADVDEDGEITIADVSALVDRLLNQ